MKQKNRNYQERLDVPWRKLFYSASGRATKKKVPFSLTHEWAEKRWTGFCELTKIPFVLGQRKSGAKFYSPSIDRIIPELGYTQENCRFVLWAVNALKSDGSDSDMLYVVEQLTLNYPYKSNT